MGYRRKTKENRRNKGYWKLKQGLTYRPNTLWGFGKKSRDDWNHGVGIENVKQHSCLEQMGNSSKSVEVLQLSTQFCLWLHFGPFQKIITFYQPKLELAQSLEDFTRLTRRVIVFGMDLSGG